MFTSWIAYALLSALFAALVAIFGKIGISHLDTTLATTVRAVVMAVFLVLVSFVFGKAKFLATINGRAMLFIVFTGVAGALSWIFYFMALRNGPASHVAAIDRLSVVFVLILALFFLGEHLTWKSGLGAFLVTLGAILMSIK
jgi:transporter family protein